jgi:uncharacterized protein (TIGR03067 family)
MRVERHIVKLLVLCFVMGWMCYLVIILNQGSESDANTKPQVAADNSIDGLWQVNRLTRRADNDQSEATTFEFRGRLLTIRERDGSNDTASVTIRPSATFAAIDLVFVDEGQTKSIAQGIYKCQGDQLILCLSDAVTLQDVDAIICDPAGIVLTGRPRDFDAQQGTLVWCTRLE